NCSRVAIGLAKHSNIRLMAISEAATFGKNAPLSKAYIRAMEEVYDLSRPIEDTSIQPDKENTAISPSNPGHQALRAVSGAAHVLSVPMMQHARCVGVITLERPEGEGFDPSVHAWFDAFSALAAPIVEQRTIAERSVPVRLIDNFKSLVEKLFGPGYLVWKAAAAILVLLMAILILVPVDYRVTSRTVIEGKSQVMVSAPFDGFIGAAYVRAGDTVRKGQPLLQLNDRELRIEEAKWASERDQYSNRLREAMAKHDLTGVQVIGAQLRQAEAQLALVTDKIVYAHVVAPFDGIVVSGDLSQKIGAPVEIGKKLFEIAPLHRYRVIIQVDEREIRHIRVGETGQIVITGIAADPLPITVAKVTPVAIAQDGENFFRVEATLSRSDPRLRPGMEGVAKIGVGRRQLWWVVTHSFTDWLRLQLWSWLP
ncbi:MAG: efflux RND transporter periplasmic adaptor subunit, partial [Halothiobacillus sp.]|nr:efflux RND transporter periplasmic adaptor subunit [Halothiobacillus sp.]